MGIDITIVKYQNKIPKYREQVKYIQDVLEEKDREDFSRLNKVKRKIKHTR